MICEIIEMKEWSILSGGGPRGVGAPNLHKVRGLTAKRVEVTTVIMHISDNQTYEVDSRSSLQSRRFDGIALTPEVLPYILRLNSTRTRTLLKLQRTTSTTCLIKFSVHLVRKRPQPVQRRDLDRSNVHTYPFAM